MAKLFLSYAREDAAIAERLARGLERGGVHDVWWDRDLHGGASFGSEIEQQLRDCDVVIVLWSAAGVISPWVRDEAAIGRDSAKLIPVSLGEVEPPIGFRQYHTIDIGRQGRASGAVIEKIESAVDHVAPAGAARKEAGDSPRKARAALPSTGKTAAAAAALLVVAGAGGLYLWRNQQPSALTVAIVPAAGGQAGAAADYSRSISTDMAAFLSAHGNAASVLDPSDPDVGNAAYRFSVAYSGQGPKADTSLSMAAKDEKGIVWSQSWSVPDVSSVDLNKEMSFAASRALLCALQAGKDRTRLDPTVLRLYIVACSDLGSAEKLHVLVESEFSQIVQQAPDFAAAWQDLALIRAIIVTDRQVDEGGPQQALRAATLQAIAQARRLTPKSGKILLAEAELAGVYDWSAQLPLLDQAIALEPNESLGYTFRSTTLSRVGRMRDAVADTEKATELDPLSPYAAGAKIFALMYAMRFNEAKDQIAADYRLWPNNFQTLQSDFAFSLRYGDPRHAQELLAKVMDENDPSFEPTQKLLEARANPTPANVDAAVASWRGVTQSHPQLTVRYLLALGTLGRLDEAFQLASDPKLRRFIESQAFFRPEFKGIRHDPRFMALAAQYGLVRYWRTTGNWPDFCSDVGLPYDCKSEAAKYD